MVTGGVATLVLLLVVVWLVWRTGGAKAISDNAALIGALVALGGVFTAQMVSIALDDRRTQEARHVEAQRTRETALQNYFEAVGGLLIEKPLREASPEDNLSTVVRAQTLSVLEGLDPDRKRMLLLFLYESGLIYKDKPVVSLEAANLRDVNLIGANLIGANLIGAYLQYAILPEANLDKANLQDARLQGANLLRARLDGANLQRAFLDGAYLPEASLQGAYLQYAILPEANLEGAYLARANFERTNLARANLRQAYLRDANLLLTFLPKANLEEADLIGANLDKVNLQDANLQGAKVADHQLSGPVMLQGATMPNGQKYEDWLKDKEGREEDEKDG
jgi:uncharacterized protein YjbI with pentapeptide repeats